MNPLVLDNGAHTIKVGWASSLRPMDDEPISPLVRTFSNSISNKVNSKIKVPFERGILTNWEIQTSIWDSIFNSKDLKINPTTTDLLVTEPVFNLPNVQLAYDQILFEEYDFKSVLRCPAPVLVPFGASSSSSSSSPERESIPECVLVVDSGHSFTHVVPVVRGSIVESGVRRIDIGGKLLTNHLKELISFRQWYMMDQTNVIERVKETCCYVTSEWAQDLDIANSSTTNSIVRTYVLPDFAANSTNKLGYVRPLPTGLTPSPSPPSQPPALLSGIEASVDGKGKGKAVVQEEEQLLQMSNERFTVPELLFNPSSIGLNQAGIHEAIVQSISSLPTGLQGMFWNNIVCVGGNCSFDGFEQRLKNELRPLCPIECDLAVTVSQSPTLASFLSASSALNASEMLRDAFVSREDYQEAGANASRRKMTGLYTSDAALLPYL